MTEKEFLSYFGKNIKVTFMDGDVIEGYVVSYTCAVDNEPEVAELDLRVNGRHGFIVVPQDEVESIEIIED